MRDFARLYEKLDQTTKTNAKVDFLVEYFSNKKVSDKDKLWAVWVLSGNRIPQPINRKYLKSFAADAASIPEWLFTESYDQIADLAETITLLLPEPSKKYRNKRLDVWFNELRQLKQKDIDEKKNYLLSVWRSLPKLERFVFNKLITGAFRVGASKKLVYRSIAKTFNITEDEVYFRLAGNWSPDNFNSLSEILLSEDKNISRPYPFALAYSLDKNISDLGNVDEWIAEWKWDGIRSQIVKRAGEVFIWSRGEELVTEQFPDLVEAAKKLDDGTVIDAELIVIKDGQIKPFNDLQNRLGRKKVSHKSVADFPVGIIAYDLFEQGGKDYRKEPLSRRRDLLQTVVTKVDSPKIQLSQEIEFSNWEQLDKVKDSARDMQAEGLMLKRLSSKYYVGRKKGDWWKWKVDPHTLDMVLMYAQRGSGRRATLYTDYTFGIWDTSYGPLPKQLSDFPQEGEAKLLPLAKAYSGLTDKEIAKIDNWIKRNTYERFGPVRTVKQIQVFEIAFEAIAPSSRHKSGLAVRFPRILRWRQDKPAIEANTLDDAKSLLLKY